MIYSNDTHLAEEDTRLFERMDCAWARKHERAEEDLVRDLERHGYLECPTEAIVDASAHATVTLTFTASEGTSIPAGTKVRVGDPSACPEHGAVVFATDEGAEVQPDNTSVEASATALAFGRTGNVAAGELAYLVAEVAGVIGVTHELAATGGADHQLTRAAVYRVMELVMMDLMREKDDPFDHKRRLYSKMYADELEEAGAFILRRILDRTARGRSVRGHFFRAYAESTADRLVPRMCG